MASNPYDLAKELLAIDGVDTVRASERRITVVHAPERKAVEKIPESVKDGIDSVISGTLWQPEYKNAGRDTERHSWSGGRCRPALSRGDQPAGYELQYHLVQ